MVRSHAFCAMILSVPVWIALILGCVQGLTEFLPVSSDGHLVLVSLLLHSPLSGRDALGFDIVLHAGSLLALLVAYRTTWAELIGSLLRGDIAARRLTVALAIATVPGVVAGLLLADTIGEMRSLRAAGIGFLVTGVILAVGESVGRKHTMTASTTDKVSPVSALLIGVAQAVAILPGVSRSGSTVSVGRALGLPRTVALDFSFLMAAPIIAGAVGKTVLDAFAGSVSFPGVASSAAGFGASLIVSMVAIALLRLVVVRHSLSIFCWYLFPLSALLLLFGS